MEGVYRFLLTPRWWGINVFVLLAIPFCLFMGSWQLSRFEDRVQDHRTATEEVSAEKGEAPRPLAELLPVDEKTSGDRVTVTGDTPGNCSSRTGGSTTATATTY